MSEYLDRAFAPAKLGTLPLKNRIIKAATYEGKTPDGIPGENLRKFHRDIVAGGVAMTTIGYCTTEADGTWRVRQPAACRRRLRSTSS